MGPAQLSEVLRLLPPNTHPDLLVGFDTRDDAGVLRLSDTQALVQTVDFFTPIVDDPYAYGAIAAANALSDVYAMGGRPISVLNIACFDPSSQPPEVWADVLRGAFDKTTEAGAAIMGGHSVEDSQPKFGMAVTGIVDPNHMFVNTAAEVGDILSLTKPLGTGIVTTAVKFECCPDEAYRAAVESMSTLNRDACEAGLAAGARCATDVTGFGLVGHLYNIARASGVTIEIDSRSLPLLPSVRALAEDGNVTGGARKNEAFLGGSLQFADSVPKWLREVALDPQTSGGLVLFAKAPVSPYPAIGRVVERSDGVIRVA